MVNYIDVISGKKFLARRLRYWRHRLVQLLLLVFMVSTLLYIAALRSITDSTQQHSIIGPGHSLPSNFHSQPVATIAHAISLIKCGSSSAVTGFLDAAAVLRHSIHKNSFHYQNITNSGPSSRYSYKMYAILHPSCSTHTHTLQALGYTTLIRDTPVKPNDIRGKWLRDHVEGENCCGSGEFIKLYAYHLTQHPIVVHWDMDVAVLQPLDDLYDAMLYSSSHPLGIAARKRIERQHSEDEWPEIIDAFFTRDITSAKPWEKVTGVQGGFLVARPSKVAFDTYVRFITEGNYTAGRGEGTGWGGMGYGGFQGAMAYQGVVAYYYDQIQPNTAVELNVCRWNQVAADVVWRGPERMEDHHLQCRQYPRKTLANGKPDYASNIYCEDCRNTPIEAVKTVHYTACKKPWECKMAYPRVPRDKRQQYRLENLVNVTMCMNLVREWFVLRKEFEEVVHALSAKKSLLSPKTGDFKRDFFLGYCEEDSKYIPMELLFNDFNIKSINSM